MAALIELYSNNANSVLADSITPTDTTINLDAGTGSLFPSPVSGKSFFYITITSHIAPNTVYEICQVIGRSGDVLTVNRGQQGSTAQSWSVNDLVLQAVTKSTLDQFVQPWVGIDSGTTNAYVVNTPQHDALYAGMPCTFITVNANTDAHPTLNLNGLGAYWIQTADGHPLIPGQIPANTPINVIYDGTGLWRLQSPLGLTQPSQLGTNRALVTNNLGQLAASVSTADQISFISNFIHAFENVNGNPGYINTPVDVMIQYGVVQITGASQAIGFPIAFPNTCIAVIVSEEQAAGSWPTNPTIHGANLSDRFGYFGWAMAWDGSGWILPTPSTQITQGYIAIGF